MKFKVTRTSDWECKTEIMEFTDLEQFVEWCDKVGGVIVSGEDLEIYDDYRE